MLIVASVVAVSGECSIEEGGRLIKFRMMVGREAFAKESTAVLTWTMQPPSGALLPLHLI
jgi:hypothetical protein